MRAKSELRKYLRSSVACEGFVKLMGDLDILAEAYDGHFANLEHSQGAGGQCEGLESEIGCAGFGHATTVVQCDHNLIGSF